MDLMMIALAFTRRGVLSICVDVIYYGSPCFKHKCNTGLASARKTPRKKARQVIDSKGSA